jgi:hypothetical protein
MAGGSGNNKDIIDSIMDSIYREFPFIYYLMGIWSIIFLLTVIYNNYISPLFK